MTLKKRYTDLVQWYINLPWYNIECNACHYGRIIFSHTLGGIVVGLLLAWWVL